MASILFVRKSDTMVVLADMSPAGAILFRRRVIAGAAGYGITSILSEIGLDEIEVDEDQFACFVELLIREPIDLLEDLVPDILGVYSAIVGRRVCSVWRPPPPPRTVTPQFNVVSPPHPQEWALFGQADSSSTGEDPFHLVDVRDKALVTMRPIVAPAFIDLTLFAAGHHGMPSGITNVQRQQATILPEEFFQLVDHVFKSPHELFLGWAGYAAGIYDTLKGLNYNWFWHLPNPYSFPLFAVRFPESPTRLWDLPPVTASGDASSDLVCG